MSAVWRAADARWQRNISVLVWSPVLLLGPLLTLGHGWRLAFNLALIVVIAGLCGRHRAHRDAARAGTRPLPGASTMVAATFAGATHADVQWLPVWVLVSNALPVVLRGRWLALGAAVVVGASGWAAW